MREEAPLFRRREKGLQRRGNRRVGVFLPTRGRRGWEGESRGLPSLGAATGPSWSEFFFAFDLYFLIGTRLGTLLELL